MIHPHTEIRFINDAVGLGVFATKPIPRGTIMWTRCALDLVFTPAAVAALRPDYRRIVETYSYIAVDGDSILCWDGAKHVNHSCAANTFAAIPDVDLAVRDLAAGEEITCDYGTCNLVHELACLCGAPRCRGTVRRRDATDHGATWDALVAAALPDAARVPQPLRPFVREPARLDAILRGEAGVFAHAQYHLAP
ncbi:MAG: hypothetical protein RLZZ15_2367 [Verrucomicrobiota bacterium]